MICLALQPAARIWAFPEGTRYTHRRSAESHSDPLWPPSHSKTHDHIKNSIKEEEKKNNHNKPNKPQWTTRISQQTKLKPCPKQLDPQQWSPRVLLGPLLPSHPGVLLSGGSELQPCLHPGHGMPWSHGMVTITFVMAIQWNWEYLNKNAEKCHDCR